MFSVISSGTVHTIVNVFVGLFDMGVILVMGKDTSKAWQEDDEVKKKLHISRNQGVLKQMGRYLFVCFLRLDFPKAFCRLRLL